MTRLRLRPRAVSIRAQVTVWYTAIFALLLLFLGGVLYSALEGSVTGGFDAALQLRAEQIATGITIADGGLTVKDVTGELPGLPPVAANGQPGGTTPVPAETNPLAGSSSTGESGAPSDITFGTLVRILDGSGRTVYQTPSFHALPMPATSVSVSMRGASWRATLTARDGQAVRVYSTPVSQGGKVYGVVQVGEPLASVTATLQSVTRSLILVIPLAILLGALGSYWLSGRAFRPIHTLTRTARHLGASDLHQRLPLPRAQDEVQELALTLNEMLARLDAAFSRQRRFMADASHELRTPVAAMRSMTDVVLAGRPTLEECTGVLRRVNVQTERLGALIGDLLLLARTDEGQLTIERAPVRLDLLVAEVAAVAAAQAQEHGIVLDAQTSVPMMVLGDEARLAQALLNLLDNAITFTSTGGQISVTAEVRDGRAVVTIRDTGVGIGPDHLPHIFHRFYRADPARSRATGGSGLGLAIVEWVIRAHDGMIGVESQVGHGSSFSVSLPILVPGLPSAGVIVRPHAPTAGSTLGLG